MWKYFIFPILVRSKYSWIKEVLLPALFLPKLEPVSQNSLQQLNAKPTCPKDKWWGRVSFTRRVTPRRSPGFAEHVQGEQFKSVPFLLGSKMRMERTEPAQFMEAEYSTLRPWSQILTTVNRILGLWFLFYLPCAPKWQRATDGAAAGLDASHTAFSFILGVPSNREEKFPLKRVWTQIAIYLEIECHLIRWFSVLCCLSSLPWDNGPRVVLRTSSHILSLGLWSRGEFGVWEFARNRCQCRDHCRPGMWSQEGAAGHGEVRQKGEGVKPGRVKEQVTAECLWGDVQTHIEALLPQRWKSQLIYPSSPIHHGPQAALGASTSQVWACQKKSSGRDLHETLEGKLTPQKEGEAWEHG